MQSTIPFSATSLTIRVSATGGGATTGVALPAKGSNVRITNEGPNHAYVAISSAGTAATVPTSGAGAATATPVLAGTDVVFSVASLTTDSAVLQISAITGTAGNTAALNVQVGEGA